MKYRFLSITKDIMSIIMNYAIIVALWISLATAFTVEVPVIELVGFILLPFSFYVVRKNVDGIVLFTVVHLFAAIAILWAISGSTMENVIHVLLVLGITIASFVNRVNSSEPGEKAFSPVVAGMVILLSTLILRHYDKQEYLTILPVLSLIYTALFFPLLFINKFTWFDFVNRKIITNMPTKNLVKAGVPYVLGFTGFYVVTALLCINERLINALREWLKNNIIAFIVWLFSHVEVTEETQSEVPLEGNKMDFSSLEMLADNKEPSPILLFLEQVFTYIAIVAVFGAVIALLVYAVVKIVKRFHGVDTSVSTELTEDYVEERASVTAKVSKEDRVRRIFLRPSDRIRKLYIKLVTNNKKLSDRPETLTAREFAELFPEDSRKQAYEFALIYEKARYSPAECDAEDLKQARQCISGIL